jgi:hypothetical protein
MAMTVKTDSNRTDAAPTDERALQGILTALSGLRFGSVEISRRALPWSSIREHRLRNAARPINSIHHWETDFKEYPLILPWSRSSFHRLVTRSV